MISEAEWTSRARKYLEEAYQENLDLIAHDLVTHTPECQTHVRALELTELTGRTEAEAILEHVVKTYL